AARPSAGERMNRRDADREGVGRSDGQPANVILHGDRSVIGGGGGKGYGGTARARIGALRDGRGGTNNRRFLGVIDRDGETALGGVASGIAGEGMDGGGANGEVVGGSDGWPGNVILDGGRSGVGGGCGERRRGQAEPRMRL